MSLAGPVVAPSPTHSSFDVIKALFAAYMQHESDADVKIAARIPQLHTAVYRLAVEPEFSNLLGNYVFDQRSYYPYSEYLQADLVNLEQSGFLSADNPDLVVLRLKKKLVTTFERHGREQFSPAELAALKRMAAQCRDELKHAKVL